jgi:hypothetical protein
MARSFDTIRAAIVEEYMRSYMASKDCDAVVMLKQPSGQVIYRGRVILSIPNSLMSKNFFLFFLYSYFSCFNGEVAWRTDSEVY